jgi:C_GCAxxG_C_C family probable redox protein
MQNGTCGCQAFLAAYGDAVGLSRETAMKIACGFSGGIGLTGEVCGMVVGAVILLGLKNGPENVTQKESYEKTVELAKQFSKDFRKQHQTVVCRELIQCDISTPEKYAKAHENTSTWKICFRGAKTVVDLLENKYDIFNINKEDSK